VFEDQKRELTITFCDSISITLKYSVISLFDALVAY